MRWKSLGLTPCLPGLHTPVLITLPSCLIGHVTQLAHLWEAWVMLGEQVTILCAEGSCVPWSRLPRMAVGPPGPPLQPLQLLNHLKSWKTSRMKEGHSVGILRGSSELQLQNA